MPPPVEGFTARFIVGPALRTQSDRRLVRLVRDGYENAFEEIVRRYGRALTRYAAAIVGGRAEDVTQDAFSKALLALRHDGREIELRPWLYRIVRNTALNDLRDRPPSAEALAEAIASGDDPEKQLERHEELADLMRRLRSLPEAQRAAIVMRELEGLSHEEIAAALGLSGGAARQAIFRARRALRNAAGLLLPLPLLKALLAGGATAPVEVAAGAAGVGGAAGTGVALKAATATVLVAGAVGAGVAVEHSRQPKPSQPTPAQANDAIVDAPTTAVPSGRTGEIEPEDESSGPSDHSGPGRHGESEHDDDHDGDRDAGESGDERHGGDDDEHSGLSGHSNHSGSSGHDAFESDDDGGHHSGSSSFGRSSSSSSGSGDDLSDDSSGPGSGSDSEPSGSLGASDKDSDDFEVDDSSGSSGSGNSGGDEESSPQE